jgi:hypothetical protein
MNRDGVALRVDGTGQVLVVFAHLEVCLVHSVAHGSQLQMWADALVDLRGISLHPPEDRRVIDTEAALTHHLRKIAVAQSVPAVPSDAKKDNRRLVMAPLERIGSSLHGQPSEE